MLTSGERTGFTIILLAILISAIASVYMFTAEVNKEQYLKISKDKKSFYNKKGFKKYTEILDEILEDKKVTKYEYFRIKNLGSDISTKIYNETEFEKNKENLFNLKRKLVILTVTQQKEKIVFI